MSNPQNPAPLLPSQNLWSARGICGTQAWKTPVRETSSERAAWNASKTNDAERRAARAAKAANAHRKGANRVVEEVTAVTKRKRIVGAKNNKRKKKQINAKELKEGKQSMCIRTRPILAKQSRPMMILVLNPPMAMTMTTTTKTTMMMMMMETK
jgi:hypothetical protein